MILLGSGLPNRAILLYRESTDDSKLLRTLIGLYEAWNKPEQADQWRVKLQQMGNAEEE
jgi:hypothetical protein